MTRMICLANSWRPGGRCVAGIDLDTEDWVRPVPAAGGGIPLRIASQIDVLDVVEMELDPPLLTTRFQRENRVAPNWKWKVVGKLTADDVVGLCDDTTPIFYGDGDRVLPQQIDELPPKEWKSLQLVQPRELRFATDRWKASDWRAHFQDAVGNHYPLKVKDPTFLDNLKADETPSDSCLITVSLGGPWAPDDGSQPEQCYKLAAAVIEL